MHATVLNGKLPASEGIPVLRNIEKIYGQDPPTKTSQEKPFFFFLCFQQGSSLQFKIYIARRDGQSLPNV